MNWKMLMSEFSLPLRLKRLRKTQAVRDMLRETHLHIEQFIAPLFINASISQPQAIASMPGYFQLSLSDLAREIDTLVTIGIRSVLLFGIPAYKNALGHAAVDRDSVIQQAIQLIKTRHPHLIVIADVCLCEYTDHGHCGILDGKNIDNDQTLIALSQQAVHYANAGADWVAPSSMTDGMVYAIRQALDAAHYTEVAILSYAVKYSSSFYGPFREAAQGAPKFGDRKTYQMDPANSAEALREAGLDLQEGADILMVKPAQNYLDIIYKLKQHYPAVPLAAYQVSGEYSMIKAAAQLGWINEQDAILESLLSIKRAGADLIISYFAKSLV